MNSLDYQDYATSYPALSSLSVQDTTASQKSKTSSGSAIRTKIRTLCLAVIFLVLGPKVARANEILGHAGWSVSADPATRVWGNPATKVYRENPRDARQLHTVRSGNRGGVMYVNKATNGCLLAHDGRNGAPAGYWQECQANDPKMNWYREHVGGGDYRLRNVAYPEFCLDAPANQEGGLVHIWQCLDVPAQRFRLVQANPTPTITGSSDWSQLTLWNGYALDSNNGAKLATQYGPAAGLWDADMESTAQDFRFVSFSDGGFVLQQRSSGKCLDSTTPARGANPILHTCSRLNPNQRWEKVPVPGGQFHLRRKGTNLCLDSTGDEYNGRRTHLWTCEGGNQNQRFQFKNTNRIDEFYDYEVWLVARKAPTMTGFINWEFSPGHAFIGIVGRRRDNNQWAPVRTYSFWPNGDKYESYQEEGTDLTIDYPTDFKQLEMLLQSQEISPRGHAVRKARLTPERAKWIMEGAYRQTNCVDYRGVLGVKQTCNCMDYSTRLWHDLTGGREDFRFGYQNPNNYSISPDTLVINMNYHTYIKGTEFLDNGRPW